MAKYPVKVKKYREYYYDMGGWQEQGILSAYFKPKNTKNLKYKRVK